MSVWMSVRTYVRYDHLWPSFTLLHVMILKTVHQVSILTSAECTKVSRVIQVVQLRQICLIPFRKPSKFLSIFFFIYNTHILSLSLSLSSSFLFLYHLVSFSFSFSKRLYMLYLQSYQKTTQLICCTILFLSFNDKFITECPKILALKAIINHMYRSDKEYWKPCTWIPSPELTLQFLSFALSAFWLAGPNKKKSE